MSSPIPPLNETPSTVSGNARPTRSRAPGDAVGPINETVEQQNAEREALLAALQNKPERIEFGGRTAEFSYNKDLGLVVVKVFSSVAEPREVVRQIPPEQYLAFAARYHELLGLMFDEQV